MKTNNKLQLSQETLSELNAASKPQMITDSPWCPTGSPAAGWANQHNK